MEEILQKRERGEKLTEREARMIAYSRGYQETEDPSSCSQPPHHILLVVRRLAFE